jgi:membrane protease subunit (stomatin/prohibitin family)
MGIMDFLKKQFIDVIDWTENQDGVLAFRYPMQDREIQNGGKLTVRDSQWAMFVNEGKIADVFGPGLYTLNTQNLPILTNLRNWDKAFQSPFKSDVYFFSAREQLDQKWGTTQPVTIRDKEFGPIRIRAFGNYSYQIKDPKTFYQKISGTREAYTTQELDGQLKAMIMTSMASFFGGAEVGFVDMAANQQKFSNTLKEALSIPFGNYGLALQTFQVESVSLPEEVQTYLDKKSSMSLLGDLGRYAQFQTAEAIGSAAKNPGGLAGAGAGLGAGMAIGQAMSQALQGGSPQQAQQHANEAAEAQDTVAMLGKLHELLTKGVLTQAEFDAKKAELLKKIM